MKATAALIGIDVAMILLLACRASFVLTSLLNSGRYWGLWQLRVVEGPHGVKLQKCFLS